MFILIDQFQLIYNNLPGELPKLESKFQYEINNLTNQIKFNYKNLAEEISKLQSKFQFEIYNLTNKLNILNFNRK